MHRLKFDTLSKFLLLLLIGALFAAVVAQRGEAAPALGVKGGKLITLEEDDAAAPVRSHQRPVRATSRHEISLPVELAQS